MRIVLIRHFKTKGNEEGRYIGRTDEPLLEGTECDVALSYPSVEQVYVSPLLRCIETAKLVYPDQKYCIIENFKECDFGQFEGKNYKELSGNPMYQAWIESGGTLRFPEGESPLEFQHRCCSAFMDCVEQARARGYQTIALVIHGGTIMSIMKKYDRKQGEFYSYQVKNGEGYVLELNEVSWNRGEYFVALQKKLEKDRME